MNTTRKTLLDMRHDPQVLAQDRRRGHRFQPPKAQLRKIPELYSTEHVDLDEKTLWAHFFTGSKDWWVAELDQTTGHAFGASRSHGHPPEWGYFDLYQLAVSTAGYIGVERDCWWDPAPAREVLDR